MRERRVSTRRIELPPRQERAALRPVPIESAPVAIEPAGQTTEVEPQPRRPIRALW